MGAWGVTARQSDTGLDYLSLVQDRHLQEADYQYFDVRAIVDFLKAYIFDGIVRYNAGCSDEEMETYIEANFPYRYGHAVLLIAECLADYFDTGELAVDLYNDGADEPQVMKISKFIYTGDDLRHLLGELQGILKPDHDLYDAWKDSDSFDEWQTHVQALCDKLQSRMGA